MLNVFFFHVIKYFQISMVLSQKFMIYSSARGSSFNTQVFICIDNGKIYTLLILYVFR